MSSNDQNAAEYAVNAQYYEAIFPQTQFEAVTAGLAAVLTGSGTVVEIGSGTGMFTEQLLELLSPSAELFAVEPSAVMRGALVTRLSRHPRAAALTVLAADGRHAPLPPDVTEIDGLVLLHVLTHFSPDARADLWQRWLPTLAPGAVVVVDQQWPSSPQRVPAHTLSGRTLGRHRYETCAEAVPLSMDPHRPTMQWQMTYRVWRNDLLVGADTVRFPSHVVSRETLDRELQDQGLRPVRDVETVWCWRRH